MAYKMHKGVVALFTIMALYGCATEGSNESTGGSKDANQQSNEAEKKREKAKEAAEKQQEKAKEAKYLKKVRANIPTAAAYDDVTLLAMAENVCALGSVDLGVEVLDNYRSIEAEDRAELAGIALKSAC